MYQKPKYKKSNRKENQTRKPCPDRRPGLFERVSLLLQIVRLVVALLQLLLR